jgi:hypothetical protein
MHNVLPTSSQNICRLVQYNINSVVAVAGSEEFHEDGLQVPWSIRILRNAHLLAQDASVP